MGDTYIIQFFQGNPNAKYAAIVALLTLVGGIITLVLNMWDRIDKNREKIRAKKQAPLDWVDGIKAASQSLCSALNRDDQIAILKDIESLRRNGTVLLESPFRRITAIKKNVNECLQALDNQIKHGSDKFPSEYKVIVDDYVNDIIELKNEIKAYLKDFEFIADNCMCKDVEVRSKIELSHHPGVDPVHWSLPCSDRLKVLCNAAKEDHSVDIVLNLIALYFKDSIIPKFDDEIDELARKLDGGIRVVEIGKLDVCEYALFVSSPESKYNVALYYKSKRDWENAASWFMKSAEQDYSMAQYELGICYRDGRGCVQESGIAYELFCKAGNQGVVEAMYEAGEYCIWNTCEGHLERAEIHYKDAAKNGFGMAALRLGVLKQKKEDFTAMLFWFDEAIRLGILDGYYYASVARSTIVDVIDYEGSLRYAFDGIRHGVFDCYAALCSIFFYFHIHAFETSLKENFYSDFEKIKELTVSIFLQVFETSHISERELFDTIIEFDKTGTTTIDSRKIIGIIKLGAEKGHPICQYYYGEYLGGLVSGIFDETGKNIAPIDRIDEKIIKKKLFELFSQASMAGLVDAQAKLGDCLRRGIGTIEQFDLGESMIISAAKNGSGQALWMLGKYHFHNNRFDYALRYFLDGAKLGDYLCFSYIFNCLQNGIGITENIELGRATFLLLRRYYFDCNFLRIFKLSNESFLDQRIEDYISNQLSSYDQQHWNCTSLPLSWSLGRLWIC